MMMLDIWAVQYRSMVLLYHTLGVKSSNTGDKVEKRHGARSGFDRASKL